VRRVLLLLLGAPAWAQSAPASAQSAPALQLLRREDPRLGPVSEGTFRVFENRSTKQGRQLDLHLVVLHARQAEARKPDPVFYLAGGPGGAATDAVQGQARSWLRETRDLVFVDQRGTGKSNRLQVPLPGSDEDLQGYLTTHFDVAVFKSALPKLQERADLTQYTTWIAADDLDEVRAALGYEQINLTGGSYGTRMALVYMRQHEPRVRAAILNGVAPIAFVNPLYHARAAQDGFDVLCAELRKDPSYKRAYDRLQEELDEILSRLEQAPAKVVVAHPRTGDDVTVELSRDAFAEALRVLLYYMPTNRQVPRLLHQAHAGDYAPFAEAGIRQNRQLRGALANGMLMSVVGSEDIPRIEPAAIARETKGTFLGDFRVRTQMAVAAIWPRGAVPADYGQPVSVKTPTLLISGTHDPVTPPRWGAEASSHLPNSLHLVVPGAHDGRDDPRLVAIQRAFLDRASVKDLDVSPALKVKLPRCPLPE
jgi:pimeloyl-ACP methyl ester carboxylesterase